VYTLVISGGVYHRSRCDVLMATWGQRFLADNFAIYSDQTDEQQKLPVINISPYGRRMNYGESQEKWLLAWAHAFARTNLSGEHQWSAQRKRRDARTARQGRADRSLKFLNVLAHPRLRPFPFPFPFPFLSPSVPLLVSCPFLCVRFSS
jgi:hypothetical protein